MENRPFKKVFFPLLSSTVFIFGFSHAGSFALDKFTGVSVVQPSTSVASVDIGGQSEQQAKEALAQAAADWKATANMSAELSGEETPIDLSVFHIDINKSLQSANEGGQNPLAITLDAESLMEQLTAAFPDMKVEEMDTASFQQDLLSQASMLPSSSVISLSDYFPEGSVEEVTAEALTEEITVTPEVKRFIETFPQIVIKQGTDFSFLRHLDENGFAIQENGEDLSVISSLLYKLILQSNFSIIERNTSAELPEEIELGYEAKIDEGSNQDFVFANPNKTDYVIQLELLNNQIYGKLIGFPLATDYKVALKDKEEFSPKKIVQYNPFLDQNVVQVPEEGRKGVLIKVFRQSVGGNGELLEEKLISEDFYPPVHRIEIHSLEEAPEDIEDTDIVEGPVPDSSDSEDSAGPPPNSGSSQDSTESEQSVDDNEESDAASDSASGVKGKKSQEQKKNK
ncbi:VanW family protein [Bacillus sp. SCS-153A]|uniref:VanW family protein n=1 Tax=Rossellomorea sedimentorum TaxID=3115294 RepID=UPI00390634CA